MKLNKIYEAYRHVDFVQNEKTGDGVKHEVVDKNAVKRYTADSYEYNDILHRHGAGIKGAKPAFSKYHIINGLQEEIHAQPKHDTDLHAFSGTSFDVFRMYVDNRTKTKIGNPLKFMVKAFTSTSSNLKIATSYAKSFLSETELVHDHEDVKNIVDATGGIRYAHVLCFELNGKKALKIDDSTGGYFSDEEQEFVLPHSIDVEIHGMPTYNAEHQVLVWDAKITTDFEKVKAEPIEYNPKDHHVDSVAILTAITALVRSDAIDNDSLYDYLKNLRSSVQQMTNEYVKHGSEGKIVCKYINLILVHIAKNDVLIDKIGNQLKIIIKELGFNKDYLLHAIEPGQNVKALTSTFDKIMD
jgi:hypothetical protein